MSDDSVFLPGSSFTKIWRLRNSGTCTWTTNYRIVFVSGHQLAGQNFTPLPNEIRPGQTVDIAINFTAPIILGEYRGNWMLRNERGELFGTSSTANQPFWVSILVRTPPVAGTVFNFVDNICSAHWFSAAGTLDCPGANNNRNGFVLRQNLARLEDGTVLLRPSLITVPQNTFNGYIRAVYPSFKVQSGDRLLAIIGCENRATSCGVLYRIDYQLADGLVRDFWAFGEQYDGNTFVVELDLGPLAGQDAKFVLTILSLGDASRDRAVWVEPRIVRNAPSITPTP